MYSIENKMFFSIVLCSVLLVNAYSQEQTDTLVVYFDIDKYIVDSENNELLEKIICDENVVSISVYGYTDFLGSEDYNRRLSERRSVNVCNYLIDRGIDAENIIVSKGEGIHPLSSEKNRTDASDKGIRNHRIALVIYTKNLSQDTTIYSYTEHITENSDNGFESELTEDSQEIDNIEEFISEQQITVELSEENLVQDNTIVLNRIFFYYNTYEFPPGAYPALYELLEAMKKHSTLKIEIHGHICCFNNPLRNDLITLEGVPLSVGRAKAVYDFLIENGISSERLSYQGFGNTRRRYQLEQNEYERAMNRRVEILIIER